MEELLLVLAVGVAIGLPVLVVILLVWAIRQGRSLRALEARLTRLEIGGSTPAPTPRPDKVFEDMLPDLRPDAVPLPASEPMAEGAGSSPWQATKSAPPTPPGPATSKPTPARRTPRAFVLRADKMRALGSWLATNWIYVVAAVSLALAGIFLLQYGIENGLLPPVARVAAALLFGAGLIGAGEYLRRRWGDGDDSATAFLPSVFSGAGIITLFAAILAALHLYALIGPLVALAGLVAVAAVAIVLGWYSGPLLAAIGLIGAIAAPFIVGGDSETPDLLYAYFTLITLVGMVVDAVRRWAWVTLLALVLGYGSVALLYVSSGGAEGLAMALTLFALAAIAVPPLSLTPRQSGAALWQMFQSGLPAGWPEFPTRVAWGAMATSSALLALLSTENAAAFWLCIILLAALFAALAIWARQAPALDDLAAAPLVGFLATLVLHPKSGGEVFNSFSAFATAEPGTPMPTTLFVLAAIGAGFSALAVWRSLWGRAKSTGWPTGWAAGAALAGPLTIGALEIWWRPSGVIGAYPWALTAAAMALLMGLFAGWFAARDGADKRRTALVVLASLSMIAFALSLILSDAALTLALALTLLIAAVLDRRYDMRALSLFVQAGVIVIGWRLVWSPGVEWAILADLGQMVAAFTGSIVALVWAHSFLRPLKRTAALITLESGAVTLGAIFVSLLVYRIPGEGYAFNTHWSTGLFALVWLVSAANQIWRLQAGGGRLMRGIRLALATVFGGVGLLILTALYLFLNPLTSVAEIVIGPVVFNTLLLGFLAPALLFGLVAWRFTFLPRWMRGLMIALASAMAAYWLFLAIRHAWQGPILAMRGYTQGELYSYTIAMLVTGAGLLYQAIARASTLLRRLGMSVIALTVAKVFLIDMSGLTGLTRVFSFLALGLSLAGLAWLNRWAAGQSDQTTQEDDSA